jgi:hypothetical protein
MKIHRAQFPNQLPHFLIARVVELLPWPPRCRVLDPRLQPERTFMFRGADAPVNIEQVIPARVPA